MATTGEARSSELESKAQRVVEEVLNAGNVPTAEELLADDLVVHGLGADADTEGREAFLAGRKSWRDAVPDSTDVVDEVVAAGDTVVLFCTRRGTLSGPYGDVPAIGIGRTFEIAVVHKLRFDDGRVVEWWRLANAMGMARQLGVLPDSPGALARIVAGQIRHRLVG